MFGFTLAAGLLILLTALYVSVPFDMTFHSDWRVWLAGCGSGLILVTLCGLILTRQVRRHPPAHSLR